MVKTMTRAPTAAPADLPRLKGAPERLRRATAAHDKATADLSSAEERRAEVAKKLSSARWEETQALEAAVREQTSRAQPARGVTFTQSSAGEGQDRSIGPQGGGHAMGPDYGAQSDNTAMRRYSAAKDAVGLLEPLLIRLDTDTIPSLRQALHDAREDYAQAEADTERLEAAKITHATPELASVDAAFNAAATTLNLALVESEAVRERLIQGYGYDERFSTKVLAGGLSPEIVALVDTTRPQREAARRVDAAYHYAPSPAAPAAPALERGLTITEVDELAPRSLEARKASTGGVNIQYAEEN